MSGYIGCEGAGCGVGDRCSRLGAGVARKAPGKGLCGVCTERDIVCVRKLVQDPGRNGSPAARAIDSCCDVQQDLKPLRDNVVSKRHKDIGSRWCP